MFEDELSFITPATLRNNIRESLNYVVFLYTLSATIDTEYKDETIRTIILYNSAVIEALLLFRSKKKKIKYFQDKYSYTHTLPAHFQPNGGGSVLTIFSKVKKDDARVWFSDLLNNQSDFLGKTLTKDLKNIYDIRNTFHLSKSRAGLDFDNADKSSDLVVKVITKLKKEFST